MTESNESTPNVVPVTRESLDDLGQLMLGRVDGWAAEANECQAIIAAANSDDAKAMVVTLRSSHPLFPEFQEAENRAAELLEQIDRENEPNVEKPTAEQEATAKTTLGELQDQAKNAIQFLVNAYGEGAKDLMPEVLRRKRGGGSHTSGTGKRPRMQGILVFAGLNTEGELLKTFKAGAESPADKPTFSATAKFISEHGKTAVSTESVQQHAFEVAGTNDLSTVEKVEFGVTVGENHYWIVATSKQTDK